MPGKKRLSRFGQVTREGRITVNVDRLYRSKRVQETMAKLDDRINTKTQPEVLAYSAPLQS